MRHGRAAAIVLALSLALCLAGCEGEARRDPALAHERRVEVEELPEAAPDEELPPPIAETLTSRCAFVSPIGERALALGCEEAAVDSPLSSRATVRILKF
mgnify:CR=1 FL=1